MTPKVLVTGASGFLGFHITKQLLEANYRVVAFIRSSSDTSLLNTLDCSIHRGSLSSKQDIETALKDCDFLVHAASKTSQDSPDFEDYREANITSTKLLMEASEKFNIKNFIFISSANAFTMGSKENPGDENSGFMPFLKNSGYAHSKYKAQKLVLQATENDALPAIVLAPTFLVGPYDSKPSSGRLLLYVLKNKVVFYPKGGKSYVDVKAVATTCVRALKRDKQGESYVLSGVNLTYKEYFKKVAAISGQSKVLVPIPKILVSAIATIASVLPFKSLLLLKTNLKMLFSENYFSNAKAQKELDMPKTNIDSAISESITWFQKNNYI